MVRGAFALLLLLPALAFAQSPQPTFLAQPNGVVAAVLPVSLLDQPSVRKQLGSGLTTTFLVVAREGKRASGARIEIRYDLWDEVWLVRRVEFDRKTDKQRIASRDALEKWWREPLRLTSGSSGRLEVELTVLPFSAAEEEDARQWIAKSGGVGTGNGSGLVDALIGTTINARPIVDYRWDVEVRTR